MKKQKPEITAPGNEAARRQASLRKKMSFPQSPNTMARSITHPPVSVEPNQITESSRSRVQSPGKPNDVDSAVSIGRQTDMTIARSFNQSKQMKPGMGGNFPNPAKSDSATDVRETTPAPQHSAIKLTDSGQFLTGAEQPVFLRNSTAAEIRQESATAMATLNDKVTLASAQAFHLTAIDSVTRITDSPENRIDASTNVLNKSIDALRYDSKKSAKNSKATIPAMSKDRKWMTAL